MNMQFEDSDSLRNQSISDDGEDEIIPVEDVHWRERIGLWNNHTTDECSWDEETSEMASIDPYEAYRKILQG
jgi:hypothetical protein